MSCLISCIPQDNNIYVILPYFNFCKFDNRRRLLIEFIHRMRKVRGVRIVVSEGKLDSDEHYDLPELAPLVYMHYHFSYPTAFWLKENLINLATDRLPAGWKYMAWIDADITFVNDNWARDTVEALSGQYDVVYLWETCVNLGPNGEVIGDKPDKSFGYMHKTSKYPYHQRAKYGFWHPGYAVACNRKAFKQMGGLVDFAVLGSGDRHMALALIGKVEWSAPGNIHPGYLAELRAFQSRAAGLRLGYVPGTIVHHWHGDKANRRYVERWEILTKGAYNPNEDLMCLPGSRRQHHLSPAAKARLESQILEYFIGRQEDGK